MYLAPIFIMHLRGLAFFTLLLSGTVRRSARIGDSGVIAKAKRFPLAGLANRAVPVLQNKFGRLAKRHVENPTLVALHSASLGARTHPVVMGEEVGPRRYVLQRFSPSAFTIRRQVGQLGFSTETEWQYYDRKRNPLDPSMPSRSVEASGISVRLFEAKLADERRVLLKEYLGDARSIGENEMAVHSKLYIDAEDSGQPRPAQVGSLLGMMQSDGFDSDAFIQQWKNALPNSAPPVSGELWLVFEWEPLRTMTGFATSPQIAPWFQPRAAQLAQRKFFVRVATGRTLQLLRWLHGKGIVHRSLGGSSILLSTYDQTQPQTLSLKVVDLGFAAMADSLPEDEVARAMRSGTSPLSVFPLLTYDDLHALAYIFLELVLSSLSATNLQPAPAQPAGWQAMKRLVEDRSRPPPQRQPSQAAASVRPTDWQSLKRLVEDIFGGDVRGAFRDYCAEEPEWTEAVAFLDEKDQAGWKLAQQLTDCRLRDLSQSASAIAFLESEFFADN